MKEDFSLIKRAQSFAHAGRGIKLFMETTHNAWVQVVMFVLVIILGFYLRISNIEWVMLVFAGGLVLSAEAFNTAIEIDINLTSPEYHPYARDVKDVSAGAVLLSTITASIVGILVFAHYLI